MSGLDPLSRIPRLYHFTDRRNLPLIRQLGGIYSMSALRNAGHAVVAPGGNQWSHDADRRLGLDEYVHLCFRDQHPMEFRAKQDDRIVDSVFLIVDSDVLRLPGVMFTPDVSNKAGVARFTLEEAKALIDFEALYSRTDWSDADVKSRRLRAAKYEILVPHGIALSLVRNFPDG